jgi:hypothetical protein
VIRPRGLSYWLLVGLAIGVGIATAFLFVAVGSAIADEELGPGEPAAVYELPEDSPSEPTAPEDQQDCPEDPDSESGEEVVYSTEATQLPAICRALSDRLDRARERTFWVVAETRKLREEGAASAAELKAARQALEELRDSQCEPDCAVIVSDPVQVHDAAGEQYGREVASLVEQSGEGMTAALWMLIGIAVVGPAAGIFWLTLKRGVDGG